MENFKNNLHKVNFFILFFIIYLTLKELQIFAFNDPIFFSKPIYLYIFEYFFVIVSTIFFFKSLNFFLINKKFLSLLKIFFFYIVLFIIYGLLRYLVEGVSHTFSTQYHHPLQQQSEEDD